MVFNKAVSKENYCNEFIQVLNGLLGLTEKEIEVFAELMLSELSQLKLVNDCRKDVRTKLGISQYNLNNYIKGLKEKGALKYVNNELRVAPYLLPKPDRDGKVEISFVFKFNNVYELS